MASKISVLRLWQRVQYKVNKPPYLQELVHENINLFCAYLKSIGATDWFQ